MWVPLAQTMAPPASLALVARVEGDASAFERQLPALVGESCRECAVSKIAPADTAFPHRGAAFYTEWDVRWSDSATEEGPAQLAVEQMRLDMAPYVTGSYVNVPDPDIADWQTAYYGDNAARLRQIKAQYDPGNVFQFEQSIPPAS